MFEDNVAALHPLLNGVPLNVDVAGVRGWFVGVRHQDGGLIVAVDRSGSGLSVSEIVKDRAEVFRHFGSLHGGNEFGLC
jgi:hypothetical protein